MWRRGLAFLIDMLLFLFLGLIENALGIEQHPLVGFFNLVVFLLYFAGMDYFYGGTLGKRMFGLRVALPNSPDVPFLLLARAFLKLIVLFPPFGIAYALTAIWRKDGRSLADLAVGSAVVELGTLAPPAQPSFGGRIGASLLAVAAPILFLVIAMLVFLSWVIVTEFDKVAPFLLLPFAE